MNVKKMITGLVLLMLLSSGAANADWGDVYYCHMTNNNGITLEGEKKNYILEKFTFKLDQTKNAMVFGSTGYFKNGVSELMTDRAFPSQEKWYAKDKYSMTYFGEGKFLDSTVLPFGITSISADCEKF